jgi:ADP-dependent phosphofructokinase/glucokinase
VPNTAALSKNSVELFVKKPSAVPNTAALSKNSVELFVKNPLLYPTQLSSQRGGCNHPGFAGDHTSERGKDLRESQ